MYDFFIYSIAKKHIYFKPCLYRKIPVINPLEDCQQTSNFRLASSCALRCFLQRSDKHQFAAFLIWDRDIIIDYSHFYAKIKENVPIAVMACDDYCNRRRTESMKANKFFALLLCLAMLLGILPTVAWATQQHIDVLHMEALDGDCSKPGRREYWHCGDEGCGKYFADAALTQEIRLADTFADAPASHSYDADGLCTVCGETRKTMTFVKYGGSSYSSDMDGLLVIFVAFHGGKAYVMGNRTLEDGSREAVQVPVKNTGTIETDSGAAEFFAFDYAEATFNPDGGYMTAVDGKIRVYDQGRRKEAGLPGGIQFAEENELDNSGCLWWHGPSGDDKYIVFDDETLTFRPSASADDSIVCYVQIRIHENLQYTAAVQPTCTQQGTEEYWYCKDCDGFYQNHNFETPVAPEEVGGWVTAQTFTVPALGHRYEAGGACLQCGIKRPVYTQISTVEAFDALGEDASYILVVKDGSNTYAAFLPDYNNFVNPCDIDSDGDGTVDVLQMDANGNTIPDCIEILFADWCNCDMDGDGDMDEEDYQFFVADFIGSEATGMEAYKLFLEDNYWDISMIYESQFLDVPNYVEVIVAADGSITLADEGVMEFQMMSAGVWGGAPYSEEGLEHFGILQTERICAAWIPNYWIGNNGMLGYYGEGHFDVQYRSYGDEECPGITDQKNWKISFNDDGSVCMVATWEQYSNSGALQFVKYTDENGNEKMTIVGLPDWLWNDSSIMENRTETLAVYLYAAQPSNAHVHHWDGGIQTKAPACVEEGQITYTCADCGEQYTEQIPATGHQRTHVEHERDATCGTDGYTGDMVCDDCGATVKAGNAIPASGHHVYEEWIVITEPTAKEPGLRQRDCKHCDHVQQEIIEALGVPLGDVNGDGTINARDARILLRFLAGLTEADEIEEAAADFNGDAKINVRDAREILRHIAGLV